MDTTIPVPTSLLKTLGRKGSSAWAALQRRRAGCLVCSAPVPERNRGDQALLAVVIDQLQRRGCGPLTVLTTSNQPIRSLTPGPELKIRDDLYPVFMTDRCFREELRFPQVATRHTELLVIGADVLDEGYSVERSAATMHAIHVAARLGLKTRILGFSVNGPPSPGLAERLNRLGEHTRLFVRDPESYRRLEAAGIRGIERAGDLAFLLEPPEMGAIEPALRQFAEAAGPRLMGLNLTKVVLGEYGREEDRLALMASACQRLAQEDGCRFLLIPHDEPEGVDYLKQFARRLGEGDIARVVAPLPHSRMLKRLAGLCTHVFTCRLHLGIATLGMGRPMTGFPYQGKFEGQFELFGLSPEGLISPERFPTTVDDLVALMRRRIAESESLATQIRSRLPTVRELSLRNFDGLGSPPVDAAG